MNTIPRPVSFLLLAALPLLAACGNKGPLVMPQKPVPVEQALPVPPAIAPVQPDEPMPSAVPVDPATPEPAPAAPVEPAADGPDA